MKSFIKKSFLFLLGFTLSVAMLFVMLSTTLEKKTNFKLDQSIQAVIFGHSHSEYAFNDSIITGFKNLSQSGESYFYTYLKVKKVLEDNPQIKHIFIEFSNIDITKKKDQEIWSNKYVTHRLPNYAALMTRKELAFLICKNPKAVLQILPKTIYEQAARVKNKNYNYLYLFGNYQSTDINRTPVLLNLDHKPVDNDYVLASTENIAYLKKIIAYCDANGVNTYLVRSPMHPKSLDLSNETLFQKTRTNDFKQLPFLDYAHLKLNDSDYRDFDHLNSKGAKKFSERFKLNIEKLDK